MKYIKMFEQFVNETINESIDPSAPANVKKVAKMFKSSVEKNFDVDDAYDLEIGGLQVIYVVKDTGFGEPGWQIADAMGNELYSGTNDNQAIAVLKKNM
jgi:hypothetical protein